MPNNWDDHKWALRYARRFAERNMTAWVRIVRMKQPAFDDANGVVTPVVSDSINGLGEVYYGPARVYTVSGPVTYSLGDEQQYYSSSYISIPVAIEDAVPAPQVDDVIEVVQHDDPLMAGRMFRVMDVEAGGQWIAARRMQVTGIQRARNWSVPDKAAAVEDGSATPDEWRI